MISLIPNQEKKKMAKGFYYRLLVLFLAMAGISMLVSSVSILPSYLLSIQKKSLADTKLKEQKREPLPPLDQKTLDIKSELENKLAVVEDAEKNKFIVSLSVINAIILKKTPGIKITKIFYENDLSKGGRISVGGTAPSREVLLLFRQALERGVDFKSVDLPISNFIKGSDIRFFLNLIPS